MRAEIVAVGTELLLGEHPDTNSAWISARLAEVGVDVHRHTTVGDNVARMVAVVAEAAARAEAVIVTGGLGPTQDDLTRVAIAQVAGVALVRDDALVDAVTTHFARAGRAMPPSNLLQADLPLGARPLVAVGSAPGFALELPGGCVVYCVPGVPREMEVMVARDVVPELAARGGLATTVSRVVRTAGMAESAVGEACNTVVERLDVEGNPTIAFLASRGETRVRVTARAASRAAALALADPVVDELVTLLGVGVVGVDDEGLAAAVGRQLRRLGWTLAVGESVSAGGLGARIVEALGASDYFRGGLITYATEAKVSVAGVDPGLLERHGPVSEAVAGALAAGARDRLEADVGLAVVGVAGPTEQNGQPVGTVCVAAVLPGTTPATRMLRLPGGDRGTLGRVDIQQWSTGVALEFLRRRLAALG